MAASLIGNGYGGYEPDSNDVIGGRNNLFGSDVEEPSEDFIFKQQNFWDLRLWQQI